MVVEDSDEVAGERTAHEASRSTSPRVPSQQGRKLFEAAPEPKQLLIVEGAHHNDLSIVGGGKYIDTLAEFVRGSIHPER